MSNAHADRVFIFQISALDCTNGMIYFLACFLKLQPNPTRKCSCRKLGNVMAWRTVMEARMRSFALVNSIHINSEKITELFSSFFLLNEMIKINKFKNQIFVYFPFIYFCFLCIVCGLYESRRRCTTRTSCIVCGVFLSSPNLR